MVDNIYFKFRHCDLWLFQCQFFIRTNLLKKKFLVVSVVKTVLNEALFNRNAYLYSASSEVALTVFELLERLYIYKKKK